MINSLILILGLATVVLSCVVAYIFARQRGQSNKQGSTRLANALSWQLIGEAVIGFITLLFTIAEFFDLIHIMGADLRSFLRFVMFGATSITTLHLWIQVRKLQSGK